MKKLLLLLLLFSFNVSAASSTTHPPADDMLKISMGAVTGVMHVNKFGRAPLGVQTTATDIWDRATQAPLQSLWVAPTQARIHAILSGDADDTAGGAGARTIQVYGLTDWDTKEVSEVISLSGSSTVNTSNSYVCIHRMKVLTKGGGTGANQGAIIAVAATDGTTTAQINDQEGQTQMAIYCIPSTQTAYMTAYYGTINKQQGSAGTVNFSLLVNPEPQTELTNFLTKNTRGLQSTGSSDGYWPWIPYFKVSGPAIIKVQGKASVDDIEASAGFNIILKDN